MTVHQSIDPADRFDWKNPDYIAVFAHRAETLQRIRDAEARWFAAHPHGTNEPSPLDRLKAHYRDHPWQFITDWGCTVDPRNPEINMPAVVPFVLFPRQVQWCEWVVSSWRGRVPGVTFKSRELGVTWLAVALACTLCLFHRSLTIGFGSRKLELVDKLGDPDSIFWKAREFLDCIPPEFKGGWTRKDAPEKVIKFPATGSAMKGEGGDEIGRGGRASIYFVDESSKLERPELVDASLSQTTNCRMDIGTANGIGNPFYRKVIAYPPDRVFRFNWRDDPRKSDEWYARQLEFLDPVTIAQEIDMDFAASVTGVVIPAAWVQSMINAHGKLKIEPTGARGGSLDVADEGIDNNAFAVSHGILLEYIEEWSGKGSDIFATTQRAFGFAEMFSLEAFDYDADGLGAGVRGDARVINDQREAAQRRQISVQPFRGSGEVLDKEKEDVKGRKNEDFFKNRKAQNWWGLRLRAQATHRAVTLGQPYDPADIISISADIPPPTLNKLTGELSQVTYEINNTGHIVIVKAPDGTRSPNLGDCVMMRFGRRQRVMRIAPGALEGI